MRRLKHAGAGAAPVTAEGTVGEAAETGRSVAFLCRKPGLPGDGRYHSRRAVAAADRRGAFREPWSLLDWARRAEKRGFAFVSTIGRVGRPSYDSLTTLAAAAGAASRIGLVTNALLAPMHPDADLAELTMTLARLSGERCPLGLGIGSRESDHPCPERPFAGRGTAFDRQPDFLSRAWDGEVIADGDLPGERHPVGPPGPRMPVLTGGHSDRPVRRSVPYGAGWTGAGGGPARAQPTVARILDG